MKIEKILVPTDFSHASDAVLRHAISLARDNHARLIIVHVAEPPAAYGGGELYYGVPDPDHTALRGMLAQVHPTDPDVPYEHHLVTGDPAHEIANLAEENDVDLVVMSTHGRSGLMRLLMGSVAEAVVRLSKRPVLTFREPEESRVTS